MAAEGEHLAAQMKNKESAQRITGESAQMEAEGVKVGVELKTEKAAKTGTPVETLTGEETLTGKWTHLKANCWN